MERICKFVRETNGDWFIDLPEWPGDRSDLQMVSGADVLLDIMAQGKNEILVHFNSEGFPGANVMTWLYDGHVTYPESGGATYNIQEYIGIDYNFAIWLCDVTKFVFNEFPKHIYYSCLTEV